MAANGVSLPGAVPLGEGRLSIGLALRLVLRLSSLAGARVAAGSGGLGRTVQRARIVETAWGVPSVRRGDFLLTADRPLRSGPYDPAALIRVLDGGEAAGLAVRACGALPAGMRAEAERLGFPLVEVPTLAPFDNVCRETTQAILSRRAADLARVERLHYGLDQVVLDGGDLTDIAQLVRQALDTTILLASSDGSERASAGPPRDVQNLREVTQHGPDGTFVRAAISAGGSLHGHLVAASPAGLDDVERYMLDLGSRAAAHVFATKAAVQAAYATYEAEFLRDLLEGRGGSPQRMVSHGASLGWNLDRPLAVAVVRPVGPDGHCDAHRLERLRLAWARRADDQDESPVVVSLGGDIVVLVAGRGERARDSCVQALAADVRLRVPDCPFVLGIGALVNSPDDLPRGYSEALRACGVARGSAEAKDVLFDDLGVLRLLSLLPSHELDAFVLRTLGRLSLTGIEARDLRKTLKVLLDVNMNVAAAARILHIHYNTLRYRIAKLEVRVGPFTSNRDLRLELALALWVFEFQADKNAG